jgi:hypothetical protein
MEQYLARISGELRSINWPMVCGVKHYSINHGHYNISLLRAELGSP